MKQLTAAADGEPLDLLVRIEPDSWSKTGGRLVLVDDFLALEEQALDRKQANELLGKIGLDKKDGEGYRLRTDGKGRLRIDVMTFGGQFVQYTKISEMVRSHWQKIGIDLSVWF